MLSAEDLWSAVKEALSDSPKKVRLDQKATRLVQHFVTLLRQFEQSELDVDDEYRVDCVEDVDADPDYDPSDGSEVQYALPVDPNHSSLVRIGDELVSMNDATAAIKYFGSFGDYKGKKKRPALSTMSKKFSFIKTEYQLRVLAEYEKQGLEIDYRNVLHFVSKELYKDVIASLDAGHILHDDDLREMAMSILKKHKLSINFVASKSWIANWKQANRISSRRITKFVSRTRFINQPTIKKNSDDFVKLVRDKMPQYAPNEIFNADQSGFVMEMHTMRTLARTGSKTVEAVVRSDSNMKKSYTVMPMVCIDGSFGPKLFVVLKEPNGRFPLRGHFQAPNLIVKAYTTHMMNKRLMMEFFGELAFDPSLPKRKLLIVDSWTSWGDLLAIDSVTPAGYSLELLQIPAGCTGSIQPLDVGVFGQWKKINKKINAIAQRSHPDFHVAVRDHILMVLSLIFWQISHPDLREWVKHSWHASGYLDQHPLPYTTPYQRLFPTDVSGDCAEANCQEVSCICCLYCHEKFCFTHFVKQFHQC